MTDSPSSFNDFLAEVSASLSGSSGEATLRRINTERVLQLALEDIIQQRHDLQIRVIADSRLAGLVGADILMQIDDYEIRLALLDTPTAQAGLTLDDIERFRSVFMENPSTEIMVLTWTTEDLRSQKLSLNTVDYLREHPEQIQSYLAKAKPFQDIISEILASHMKVWEAVLSSPLPGLSSLDVKSLFVGHMKTSMGAERERTYRNEERKLAALQLPQDRELILLSNVLDEALQGLPANHLAIRLAQLPKRGGR